MGRPDTAWNNRCSEPAGRPKECCARRHNGHEDGEARCPWSGRPWKDSRRTGAEEDPADGTPTLRLFDRFELTSSLRFRPGPKELLLLAPVVRASHMLSMSL